MRRRRDVAGPGGEPEDIGAASAADADDLDRLRRRLANVIGHALRTPAATVRGQAEILSATDDPGQREEAVVALRRAARRLEEMIDEVLVVEGIDTRLPTGVPEDLELRSVVEEVAAELEVVDEVEVTGDTGARVRCGRDALRWLLRSVLDNAGRYGAGPVRVEIADTEVVHAQGRIRGAHGRGSSRCVTMPRSSSCSSRMRPSSSSARRRAVVRPRPRRVAVTVTARSPR